jgi:uncharacterized protein YutE (UPF0331/DUF86 family)
MDNLEQEILAEKEYISGTLQALEKSMRRKRKTVIELSAIGTFLQNTYSGIENILKRILKFKKIPVLHTETYHQDLLNLSVKHKIISENMFYELKKYLGFRHFFVHGYGIMMDEEKLMPLAENLPDVWSKFDLEISKLMKSLKE